jgi:peptide-methionine (R)-S-oxide reductase
VFVLSEKKAEFRELNQEEKRVIVNKGTEMPFTGKYFSFWERGTYVCKRCGAALYRSESKFESDCGWPSFDDEIPGAVKRSVDADKVRTEITCANCGAHLGHVFIGEGFTKKNTRHCVNSISMDFIPDKKKWKNLTENKKIVALAANLASLIEYQLGSVVSRTIVDKKAGTVTLFAFDEGEGLSEHTTPYDALVYVLDGEADIVISGKPVLLKKGEVTIMPANEPHALSAVTKFKMLLTMIRS